ncbi:hypothetical protein [Synechococcus sp. UW179A]|uniref:hypothetical protein n=1 Tax=Synechococcus sp. UW179A TaxID=2575510 RepID=UPI000E0ED803|nr:hypothetical protein [Synechococcus sp. UW179A]
MDQRERVQQLCEDHAKDLSSLATNVAEHRQWDLTLPVAVIDARSDRRRFHVTAVGTIGNVVRVSTTIDHPLMQQLFKLIQTRSDNSALDLMLSNADYGEEFEAIFETYREERSNGAPLWSASDAAAFVFKSKEAFDDRELAIVALLPSDPHDVVTFGIPLRYYGIETS